MTIEAEQALLGCLLVNNKAFELVSEIEPHHFQNQAHNTIYSVIHRDLVKGKPVDSITVMKALGSDLEACGGLSYLTALMTNSISAANAPRYAEIVLDSYSRWQLKNLSFEIIGNLDEQKPTDEIVGNATHGLANLTRKTESIVDLSEALSAHVDLMTQRTEGVQKTIATGLTDLDRKLNGGFCGGDLVILAARPAMGKTMCSLTMALNVARTGNVMFFSLEMSRNQLLDRAIANIGGVPLPWLRNPQDDGPEWAAYTSAIDQIRKFNLVIDDRAGRKIHEIEAIAKQQHRKKPLSMVVVDYLGLVRGSASQNRNAELGEYTKTLKGLAKAIDCPVLLLSQLNRGVEQRSNRRPLLSDLRDSGEIEADADIVMFLYRDEYYNPDSMDKGIVEIDIAKYRQGETGHVGCAFQGQYQRFADLAHEYKRVVVEKKVNTRGLD